MGPNPVDVWSLPAQDLPKRLEAALVAVETALGVGLTVSDHAALFLDQAGNSLLPAARLRHERTFCNAGRERAIHDQACLSHCGRGIPALAAESPTPFVHRCWKGGAEIVVPIRHDGVHVCTIFAGIWASDHPPAGLPTELERLRQALPPFHRPTLLRLAGPLTLVGAGLVATRIQARHWHETTDRSAIIRRYLQLHAHEDIRLGDLARHIGVSPSRASRLVRAACGRSFQDEVLHERIRRAQALLRHTHRPVKVIAERLGFHSEYYFNRAFRKIVGVPPGRWRRNEPTHVPER